MSQQFLILILLFVHECIKHLFPYLFLHQTQGAEHPIIRTGVQLIPFSPQHIFFVSQKPPLNVASRLISLSLNYQQYITGSV